MMAMDDQRTVIDYVNFTRPELPSHVECALGDDDSSIDSFYVIKWPDSSTFHDGLWICPVCYGLPRKPEMLKACGHLGCLPCYKRILQQSTVRDMSNNVVSPCPICRKPFTLSDLIPLEKWAPLTKCAFNCLRLRCPSVAMEEVLSGKTSCSFEGSLTELYVHEKSKCENRKLYCPNPGCIVMDTAYKLRQHFEVCDMLTVYCPCCCLPLLWTSREKHNCTQSLRKALIAVINQCTEHQVSIANEHTPGIPGTICREFISSTTSEDSSKTLSVVYQSTPRNVSRQSTLSESPHGSAIARLSGTPAGSVSAVSTPLATTPTRIPRTHDMEPPRTTRLFHTRRRQRMHSSPFTVNRVLFEDAIGSLPPN